jgi:hypothetical protein
MAHDFEYQDRLGRDLGQTSASPELGSNLDISDGGSPNVTSYGGAGAPLKKLFPMPSTVSTTTVWATPHQGARVHDQALGLGSQQEPSRHKSTTKYKTIPSAIPSIEYEDISSQCAVNSCPLGSPPEPINRVVYDFWRAEANTSQVSSSTQHWHLPQSCPRTWDPSLSHFACNPYCRHLGASNISLVPLAGSRASSILN